MLPIRPRSSCCRKHLSPDCFFVRLINGINPPPCLSAVIKVNPAAQSRSAISCTPTAVSSLAAPGSDLLRALFKTTPQPTIFESIMFLHKHVAMETRPVSTAVARTAAASGVSEEHLLEAPTSGKFGRKWITTESGTLTGSGVAAGSSHTNVSSSATQLSGAPWAALESRCCLLA